MLVTVSAITVSPDNQPFNRQTAILRTLAKPTHAARGTRHHAANLSSRWKATIVVRMTRNCGTMLITPSNGLLAPKNIQDQAALSASWMKNKVSANPRVGEGVG